MKKFAWSLLPLLLITAGLIWWQPFNCGISCDQESNYTASQDRSSEYSTPHQGPPTRLMALANRPDRMDKMSRPNDHFSAVRSYPDPELDLKAYEAGLQEVRSQLANHSTAKTTAGVTNTPWTQQGPTNIGGRINSIAIDPNDPNTILVGAVTGGVFRTTNGGFSWDPIFDDINHLAIGDITFEPGNSQVIYVGTGDQNIGGYMFIGGGIYKSTDGGSTWNNIGLQDTRITSRILIDPTNTNKIYAATMGLPQERNSDRGLYTSTDGGSSWTQSLYINDSTGIIDLVMDPNNSQVLYASSWNRIRNNFESLTTGVDAKIWKTTDGGTSWNHLANGLPNGILSRVNLAIDAGNPAKVYASFVSQGQNVEGVYQSLDAGGTWDTISIASLSPNALGGFGWYFGNVFVNPFAPSDIYILGVQLWRTPDFGQSWEVVDPNWWQYDVHADKHDLVFTGPTSFYLATDGGLYQTTDNGQSWSDIDEIPNTQFYRVKASPHWPDTYYGGAQDNGTVSGNAASISSWNRDYGGDGFSVLFDNNPNNLVAETQNGNLVYSDDMGFNFYDFTIGIDFNDRRNWDMPVIISPNNDQVYYTGTYRIYKNSSGLFNHNWFPISNDLTDGVVTSSERFHTITTISESPFSALTLYAGTSDGNIHVTTDGGGSWANISNGVPDRYVTSVKASPYDPDEVFATVSGYRFNEFIPHLLHSTNKGSTWTNVSGNLPAIGLNDVLIHPTHDSVWVVASDGGVYATQDYGQNWERVGNNMPICPVYDMDWDMIQDRLVAGTHARSMMTFPMDSLLPDVITANPWLDAPLRVSVYPNPTADYIKIRLPEAGGTFEILDLNGKRVRNGRIEGLEKQISLQTLPVGTYLVRVTGESGSWAGKIVKRSGN